MRHLIRFLNIIIYSIIVAGIHTPLFAQDSTVSIVDRGNYYEVTLDYTTGISHYDMGQLLMQKVTQILPNYEQLADSYLAEVVGTQSIYNILLSRVPDIKPQIPQEYQDEIDGMASQLSGGNIDRIGDGKLSKDEFYLMQLITDVDHSTQCSGISVYGSRSATGNTMTARILDWFDGSKHQLAQIQSVVTIKNGSKSICSIGYLGFMGIITGFNEEGIFAGILDSPSGAVYSSNNKRSYPLDLRYALENCTSLADVAEYMMDPSRNYAFNHLILLSDKHTSQVLENNFSGTGTNIRRALRSDTSSLNPGITWGFTSAVAAVNSFLLLGNYDNHIGVLSNTKRWNSIKTQLQLYGDTINLNEIKLIASFTNGNGPGNQSDGDIYNIGTQQIVIFQPDIFHLEVAFKPKSGIMPKDPAFEKISVFIGSSPTSVAKDNSSLPESIMLEQNYPNPFNPATTISFNLPTRFFVSLKVFDLLGRNVATIFSEELSAGAYSRQWSAVALPSGVYFYRLQAGNFVETKKLILLR
ncbi:MAG: C45 family autoproteolytic acyltransferase/hydrolase [Bacteroidota bacterium]